MPQTNLNIRLDSELKKQMEELVAELGLTMTTAFTVFAKATIRERKIPFEISADKSPDEPGKQA